MAAEGISALLLIAVVVVGALAVYGVVAPIFSTRIITGAAVEWAEAYVSPMEATVVLIVKNISPKQIRMVELMVRVDGFDVAHFNVDIPPGCSHSLVIKNPPGTWYSGETKNAVVTAVFADGSATSHVASIRIHGTGWVGAEERPLASGSGSETDQSWRGLIFADDFSKGLSGWKPWGTAAGTTVEVDKHGKPSPCMHVYADGPVGSLAGASKEVDVNFQSPMQLRFAFDYNVHALRDKGGGFPGNLWVRVLDAAGNVILDKKVYEAESADSGWKDVTVTIPPVTGRITLIIYMQMLSSKRQEFWVDNVVLEG